jgi:hypothetical protein
MLMERRFDEAVAEARKALDLAPGSPQPPPSAEVRFFVLSARLLGRS